MTSAALLTGLGALACFGAVSLTPATAAASDRLLLATPAWRKPAPLQMRAGALPGSLLLRQTGAAIYVYRSPGTLLAVTEDNWQEALSKVVECEEQPRALSVKFDDGRASLDGVALKLGGRHAENAYLSNDGKRMAVLSSAGPRSALLPFMGRGSKPPYFVDFFDLAPIPPGTRRSTAVRLPFGAGVQALSLCWSADDRQVVVHDLIQTGLAVVPATAQEFQR